MDVLRLIRWKNLLFIAVMLYLMQRSVIDPLLITCGFSQGLDTMQLALLISATMLIAAGGYAINDYFDVKIDAINKPESRIVGRVMDRRMAMIYHQVFTAIGAICGIVLAVSVKSVTIGVFALFVPGLLWFYSASYKRQFFIGNIIVAFNAALSVLAVAIANISILVHQYGALVYQTPFPLVKQIYAWIGGFALFAFLTTLIREIIKDMEDEQGDRELECHTLPIRLGFKKTKIILYGFIALTAGLLCYANFVLLPFAEKGISTRYLIIGLLLPLAILVYFIATAKNKKDYKNASTLCKFIMLTGVFYSLIFYYMQAKTFGISLFGLFLVSPH